MPIFKSGRIRKFINDVEVKTSDSAVVEHTEYRTNGEASIITRNVDECIIYLDSKTTDNIVIKSMTNTIIIGDKPIDEEYDEVELQKFASIELKFIKDYWYVTSSDGLKNS
jgi:hypothetical protein